MAVGLQLAGKNDFVKVQENINNNLTKLDEAIDFNLLATLGIPYGGILNNTSAKVAGTAYYDQTGKKIYKCIANTSLNYADASFFEAISNNDLCGELETYTVQKNGFSFTVVRRGKIVSVNIFSTESKPSGTIPSVLKPSCCPIADVNTFLSASGELRKFVEGVFLPSGDFSFQASEGTYCFGSVCFVTR